MTQCIYCLLYFYISYSIYSLY